MGKKHIKIISVLVAAAMAACLLPGMNAKAYTPSVSTVKVGLYYGSSADFPALAAANLENVSGYGSGYEFGYFDSDRNFVSLGASTSATQISMLKDFNMAYSSSGTYTEGSSGGIVVGCYHIRLSGSYSTYSAARSAASSYLNSFVKYMDGSFYAMVGNYTSSTLASTAAATLSIGSYTIDSGTSYTVAVVKTGTNTMLFEFDCGTSKSLGVNPIGPTTQTSNDVYVNPSGGTYSGDLADAYAVGGAGTETMGAASGNVYAITGDGTVSKVDSGTTSATGKALTWFKGYEYYGAFQYARLSGGNMTVVNYVNVEDYVKGVIPYEMSSSWPVEALKAQAVAARTFVMKHLNSHSGSGFDVCSTTDCQVYRGANSASANSDSAVDATAGKYLTYGGSLCDAVYHASDGGATESSVNIWGGDFAYLTGVVDTYEAAAASEISGYNYSDTNTLSYYANRLYSYDYTTSVVTLTKIEVSATTATGNVYSVKFTDDSGKTYTVSKIEASYVMNADSQHFTVTTNASAGTVTVAGAGNGHNVGMSQWGAYAMAKYYGKTYDQILKFYYTGVTIG